MPRVSELELVRRPRCARALAQLGPKSRRRSRRTGLISLASLFPQRRSQPLSHQYVPTTASCSLRRPRSRRPLRPSARGCGTPITDSSTTTRARAGTAGISTARLDWDVLEAGTAVHTRSQFAGDGMTPDAASRGRAEEAGSGAAAGNLGPALRRKHSLRCAYDCWAAWLL